MAKVGVPQGNPLAALGNILRKGPGRGSGRDSKSPRKESPLTKKSSFKESKESLRDGAKDSPEFSRRTSEPKSPKAFRFGIRRSSSRNKKGDRDDTASDTSSVNSFTAVPVKEVPMEIESSGLSVSKSANGNDEKDQDRMDTSKATETSTCTSGDTSTNVNRISTYFKPHEVEALSDLFASGELDALLGTNDQQGDSVETMSGECKAEGEGEKEEKAQESVSGEGMLAVEHVSSGNELKRNNLHSSFRMYESRYKAETLERKRDKSSFSTSETTTTVESQLFDSDLQAPHSDQQHIPVATSTPEPTNKEEKAFSDDDNTSAGGTAAENKDATVRGILSEEKPKAVKENERRRRKLFDDELFLPDISTRSQVRKKVSATAPGLDAYAQAHKSPPPVTIAAEKEEDMASDKSLDSHLNDGNKKSSQPAVETRDEFSAVESEKETTENLQNDDLPHTVVADGDGMGSSKEEKETVPHPSSPDHALAFAVIGKTQLEEDSEKREADKEATKRKDDSDFKMTSDVEGKALVDRSAKSEKAKESQLGFTSSPEKVAVNKEKVAVNKESPDEVSSQTHGKMKDDEQIPPEKAKSESMKEKVADRIRKRREEREEQKSSRSTRPYDPRSKIEPGKVSSARSKFDTSSQSASPRTSRVRASTDSSTERKLKGLPGGSDGTSPSWMPDLQKRKEQRIDRAKDKTASVKGNEVEDMPEWRQRALERRKKAAEGSKASSSTASPKLGRRHETDKVSARTDKPLRREIRSNVRKSPSPSATRKSAREVKGKGKSEILSEKSDGMSKSDTQEETDSKEEMNPTTVDEDAMVSKDTDLCVITQHESSEKDSDTKTEVTSPKPEITSPKPKIEFVSRKVMKKSGSVELNEDKSDIAPSVTATDDGCKDKDTIEEELAAETKDEQSSPSKGLQSPSTQSPSNLSSQVRVDSQESRRSSTSSEKEGVPFRSRNTSHSRSPTPTSHTPGPLKLPTDPGIPEWKKRVLERKKNPTSSKQLEPTSQKTEPVVPEWKKELLAKRTKTGEEV